MREKALTKRFVIENELDPGGNISEDVEGEEEDQRDRGNLTGKTHLDFCLGLSIGLRKDKQCPFLVQISSSEKGVKGPFGGFSGFAHSVTLPQESFVQEISRRGQ